MNLDREAEIIDLIAIGRKALSRALVWANSGNISHRLDEKRMIITSSGASLGELDENDFVVINLDSEKSERETKPSMETRMHIACYRMNKNVKAIFHSQAFFTTLLSCTDLEVDNKLFPESMAYIENVGRVPYNHPGSRELADAVAQKVGECDCIILSNHGAICAAENLDKVLLKTETLEMLCRLIAMANIQKIQLNYLPENVRHDFLKHLEAIEKTK